MEQTNPYSPPTAHIADTPRTSRTEVDRLNRVAAGQRMMVLAVLASFFAGVLRASIGDVALLVSLVAAVLAIVGVVRLAAALGYSVLTRIVCAIFMVIPLVNLIAMLVLSSRATKQLRAAGYRVGLLGASERKT